MDSSSLTFVVQICPVERASVREVAMIERLDYARANAAASVKTFTFGAVFELAACQDLADLATLVRGAPRKMAPPSSGAESREETPGLCSGKLGIVCEEVHIGTMTRLGYDRCPSSHGGQTADINQSPDEVARRYDGRTPGRARLGHIEAREHSEKRRLAFTGRSSTPLRSKNENG
jgi:hypothetical protein